MGIGGVLTKRRGRCHDCMDLNYVKMQIAHKPTIAKDEGWKVHIDKGSTILGWDTMQ